MSNKQLPLGTSDFKSVIDEDLYYVDKTALISDIIKGARVTLLPRPRRFGKTLNMSMLSYFFSNQQDYRYLFGGLSVADDSEAMEHCGQYPVIFISFKDVKSTSAQGCFSHIKQLIGELFLTHDYLLESETLKAVEQEEFAQILKKEATIEDCSNCLRFLSQILHRHYQQPVVIIIDEYDIPINSAYNHGYYDELVGFLRNLLSGAFKDNPSLFKGVLTGILRIGRESIFSGLNNIDVCTLTNSRYSQHFGFSEAETEKLMQDYGLAFEQGAIRTWYNGYNFGGITTYNPWSIISLAINQGELAPYWLNTSDNVLVRDLIAHAPYALKQELEMLLNDENAVIRKPLDEHVVFRDIQRSTDTIWNFLLFTGYLRYQDKQLGPTGETSVALSIPNQEVRYFYTHAILEWFKEGGARPYELPAILDFLLKQQLEDFAEAFEQFVEQSFSYFDVTGQAAESFYHAFVLGMLVQLQQTHQIKSNRESGFGRYDVCLIPNDTNKPAFVFEFKKVSHRRQETLQSACDAALKQIDERNYVAELQAMGIQIVHSLAIAFEGKKALVSFIQ
jgi:hypothetical protein